MDNVNDVAIHTDCKTTELYSCNVL